MSPLVKAVFSNISNKESFHSGSASVQGESRNSFSTVWLCLFTSLHFHGYAINRLWMNISPPPSSEVVPKENNNLWRGVGAKEKKDMVKREDTKHG
jgi:hypothetical protein